MNVDQFEFELPSDLIAQEPLAERDRARLLTIGGQLGDRLVADLPMLLRPGDLLVVNDTEVLPTRFWARRQRPLSPADAVGATIEVTLVEPAGAGSWWALCRPGKRLRPGDRVALGTGFGALVEAKDEEGRVRFGFALAGEALLAAIREHGAMPLPPYIRRAPGGAAADHARYQTMFATTPGSVAAPTASLHFTPTLLAALGARDIELARLTLHVGQGTFSPVKVADTSQHHMHAESYVVPAVTAAAVNAAWRAGRRVVAIGTTVLRALESAWAPEGSLRAGPGSTRLFITPGYRFRTADLLLTNFHLPRSTLFMLVAAFGGLERMKAAYAHAIASRYRFFSYGDACMIERAAEAGSGR